MSTPSQPEIYVSPLTLLNLMATSLFTHVRGKGDEEGWLGGWYLNTFLAWSAAEEYIERTIAPAYRYGAIEETRNMGIDCFWRTRPIRKLPVLLIGDGATTLVLLKK